VIIVTGGQTGVDQGFATAVRDLNLGHEISGYRPSVKLPQTEAGPMPSWLEEILVPIEFGGYVERTQANVKMSDLVLLVVQNRLRIDTPGTRTTLKYARLHSKQYLVVDPIEPGSAAFVSRWLSHMQPLMRSPMRLMVAGPRESKWPGARDLVYTWAQRVLGVQPPGA